MTEPRLSCFAQKWVERFKHAQEHGRRRRENKTEVKRYNDGNLWDCCVKGLEHNEKCPKCGSKDIF